MIAALLSLLLGAPLPTLTARELSPDGPWTTVCVPANGPQLNTTRDHCALLFAEQIDDYETDMLIEWGYLVYDKSQDKYVAAN